MPEAVGIAKAAEKAGLPVALSFTLETDGNLPGGKPLGLAISEVDTATKGYPAYYMINCVHPIHFASTVRSGGDWVNRIGGLRVNASMLSHAELDNSPSLDIGDSATWRSVMRGCCRCCPISGSSAAAAAPTTGISGRSAPPACRAAPLSLNQSAERGPRTKDD